MLKVEAESRAKQSETDAESEQKKEPRAKQSGVKKKGPASCVKRKTEAMP
ncbi:MAG: hypothetical protein H6Q13_869 [Bacteroidetes bacterium]|jgi:hypothetical protein|nr:hypothetical protein [Bacteroidota bacterium]